MPLSSRYTSFLFRTRPLIVVTLFSKENATKLMEIRHGQILKSNFAVHMPHTRVCVYQI